MRVFLASAVTAAICFAQPFGTWRMNPARSTFLGGTQPKSLTVRIEPHPKGEVFTLDRVEPDGRTTSSSSILYLDGTPRRIDDFTCSGIQTSRRTESGSVEILRLCASGGWIQFVRRPTAKPNVLVLEITEQRAENSLRLERRLILEKQ